MSGKNLGDYPDHLRMAFDKLVDVIGNNVSEEKLSEIKDHIADWFMEMYEKDSEVLKEMAKSDDLLKMIQREFRLSKLLD